MCPHKVRLLGAYTMPEMEWQIWNDFQCVAFFTNALAHQNLKLNGDACINQEHRMGIGVSMRVGIFRISIQINFHFELFSKRIRTCKPGHCWFASCIRTSHPQQTQYEYALLQLQIVDTKSTAGIQQSAIGVCAFHLEMHSTIAVRVWVRFDVWVLGWLLSMGSRNCAQCPRK